MADVPSYRFEKYNAFIDHGQAALVRDGCGAAVRLWVTLWRFENANTDSARVGLDTLAERCGTDKSHVLRMVKQLKLKGYLAILDAGKQGRGSCAVYRLLPPAEKVSPRPLSEPEIGVVVTPIVEPSIGVTTTPIETEKVSPRPRKGVPTTPVQKEQKVEKKKDTPAAVAAEGVGAGATKRPAQKKTPNPMHRPAVEVFVEAWKAKYGREYCFAAGKDASAVSFLLAAVHNDLDRFRALVGRYLADPDPYVCRNAHDLGTLRMKVNTWLGPTITPARSTRRNDPTAYAVSTLYDALSTENVHE